MTWLMAGVVIRLDVHEQILPGWTLTAAMKHIKLSVLLLPPLVVSQKSTPHLTLAPPPYPTPFAQLLHLHGTMNDDVQL